VTDRPVLTFVLSPCLTTAGLTTAGSAGSRRRSRTIGRRVPFRPMNSADRRSMAGVRLRGVVRRSMRPPDRYLYPTPRGEAVESVAEQLLELRAHLHQSTLPCRGDASQNNHSAKPSRDLRPAAGRSATFRNPVVREGPPTSPVACARTGERDTFVDGGGGESYRLLRRVERPAVALRSRSDRSAVPTIRRPISLTRTSR
jgi:hypothetical protein